MIIIKLSCKDIPQWLKKQAGEDTGIKRDKKEVQKEKDEEKSVKELASNKSEIDDRRCDKETEEGGGGYFLKKL